MWIIVKERNPGDWHTPCHRRPPLVDIIAQILSEAVVPYHCCRCREYMLCGIHTDPVAGRLDAGADVLGGRFQLAFSTAFAILGVFLVLGMGVPVLSRL